MRGTFVIAGLAAGLLCLNSCGNSMLSPARMRNHPEIKRARELQIADRSDMTFEMLCDHLRVCQQTRFVPDDYRRSVADEALGKAPWPTDEKQLIRERRIRIGFSEDQVRIAWGAPQRVRSTHYRLGELKYLHYGRDSVVHLENGRVDIVSE